MSEDTPDRMSDNNNIERQIECQNRISEDMTDRIIEDMSNKVFEDTSDRISEDMGSEHGAWMVVIEVRQTKI